MNRFLIGIVLLSFTVAANKAWGHGFALDLSADQSTITATSEAPLPGNPSLNIFSDAWSAVPNPDGSVNTFEGFVFANSGFPNGTTYTFNVTSPLYFSNGGAAVPGTVDPSNPSHNSSMPDSSTYIQIYDRDIASPTINIFGNTNFTSGFSVTGGDPHELQKLLYNFSQGDGTYGFAFTATATLPGGATVTTPTLVDEWATANFTNAPQATQTAAGLAIYNAVVPEPSSILMAGTGGAVLLGLWWKRRKRQQGNS